MDFPPTWRNALTIGERVGCNSFDVGASQQLTSQCQIIIQKKMENWSAQFPFLRGCLIQSITSAHRVSPSLFFAAVAGILPSVPEDLDDAPSWIRDCTVARDRVASVSVSGFGHGTDVAQLLNLIGPLIERTIDRVRARLYALAEEFPAAPFQIRVAEEAMRQGIQELMLPIVTRTLVLEMHVSKLHNELQGEDPEARFREYCTWLRKPESAHSIFAEYPVLARLAISRLSDWADFYCEFLEHLCRDQPILQETFARGGDLGELSAIHWNMGDNHRGARQVIILDFDSSVSVVYKPKDLSIDLHFQQFIDWFNDRSPTLRLAPMTVVNRGPYGWTEFIPCTPCLESKGVERFYARQGAYLAILQLLGATDMHFQNIIANGEFPYIVDLETLFHPISRSADQDSDPAALFLQSSLLRIGLLPNWSFAGRHEDGVDLSGLGGRAGQIIPFDLPVWGNVGTDEMRLRDARLETKAGQNQPTLNGTAADVQMNVDALVEGYEAAYRLLLDARDELFQEAGPLARFATDTVRIVLRPTAIYASLLHASWHPDVLRDALDRDVLLSWLWLETERRSRLAKVVSAEIEDLRAGDVPIFTTSPNSRDLRTSRNVLLTDFFDEDALSRARCEAQRMGPHDLERQIWVIRASAAAAPSRPHTQGCHLANRPSHAVDRTERLTSASIEIGMRLARSAIWSDDGRASWLVGRRNASNGLRIQPAGLDLYDGAPGVTLYLAYLGAIARNPVVEETARGGWRNIRHSLERSTSRPIGSIGGFDGLGGLIFLMTHLGRLWCDERSFEAATKIAYDVRAHIESDQMLDIIGGAAGALTAVLALHAETKDDRLIDVARSLGGHLLRRAESTASGCAWRTALPSSAPLTGFSHGASGIALSLIKLYQATKDKAFLLAARGGFDYERSCFSSELENWPDYRTHVGAKSGGDVDVSNFGWCHGAPGCVLARLKALNEVDWPWLVDDIRFAVGAMVRHGFGWGHCLCHGEFGNLDILMTANAVLGEQALQFEIDRIIDQLITTTYTGEWFLEHPAGGESPGLMTGLAGIGYGLLRTAHPTRVPSVLALDGLP